MSLYLCISCLLSLVSRLSPSPPSSPSSRLHPSTFFFLSFWASSKCCCTTHSINSNSTYLGTDNSTFSTYSFPFSPTCISPEGLILPLPITNHSILSSPIHTLPLRTTSYGLLYLTLTLTLIPLFTFSLSGQFPNQLLSGLNTTTSASVIRYPAIPSPPVIPFFVVRRPRPCPRTRPRLLSCFFFNHLLTADLPPIIPTTPTPPFHRRRHRATPK